MVPSEELSFLYEIRDILTQDYRHHAREETINDVLSRLYERIQQLEMKEWGI